MTLGERICQLRTRHGLSQVDLADRLAISRQSVSKWETDAAVPELDKLMRMYRPLISLPQLENGGSAAILTHFSAIIKLAGSVPRE